MKMLQLYIFTRKANFYCWEDFVQLDSILRHCVVSKKSVKLQKS